MPKRNLIWIVAIVAAGVVTVWVTRQYRPQVGHTEPGEFMPVLDTYRLIRERYCGPIDGDDLRRGAVGGMVSKLDEFSTYIPPGHVKAFARRMNGVGQGLGLRLESVQGVIRVIGPLVNSPAHRAGIISGDVIVAIDGQHVEGLALEQVEEMLRGQSGRKVEIIIERGKGRRRSISLTLGEFPLESVVGLYRDAGGRWVYLIEPQDALAYVRIKEFVPHTARRLRDILRRLGAVRGLILDLRDNPGGILTAAAEVANLFLREGVIATSVAPGRPPRRYEAHSDGTITEIPVVVLVDARTASAAEIVAGALRLHDRAVIVGTRTRGKGCVQSMLHLPNRLGQINLTTSELLIGTSEKIMRRPGSDLWGVDPHPGQEVTVSARRQEELRRLWIRAEVLMPAKSNRPTTTAASPAARDRPIYGEFKALDAALLRGLDLLAHPDQINKIFLRAAQQRANLKARFTRAAEADDE